MGIAFDYDETTEAFLFTLDGEGRPPIPRLEGWVLKEWMARYAKVYTTLAEVASRLCWKSADGSSSSARTG